MAYTSNIGPCQFEGTGESKSPAEPNQQWSYVLGIRWGSAKVAAQEVSELILR